MPIKIAPAITRSNSFPLLKRPPSSPNLASNEAKAATVFEDKNNTKARRQILADMTIFIDNQSYQHATKYIIKHAKILTEKDISFISDILSKKTANKHASEKVIEWMKYHVAGDTSIQSTAIELSNLHEELEKQIKIKLKKEKDIINNELARARVLGVRGTEYLPAFSGWLKGKTLQELQINIRDWRKFIDGCQKVKAQNEGALKADGLLIAFQGLHHTTTDLFMQITSNMQGSQALLAQPELYRKMNELITSCIDRVAPDPSSDVDSYISLHEPHDGAASRIVYNVTDLAHTIFNGPGEGQKWYLELIKHGSQWHMRGSNAKLNQFTILQSFEWQRNDDQSLTRKIAMTTYLNPEMKTHSLTLNIHKILPPHFTESMEAIALRLLQKLANKPAEKREKSFDNWLLGKNNATPHDDELRNLLNKEPAMAMALKADFLHFLKATSDTHAHFIYSLSQTP